MLRERWGRRRRSQGEQESRRKMRFCPNHPVVLGPRFEGMVPRVSFSSRCPLPPPSCPSLPLLSAHPSHAS
eukprot:8972646-Pyramimonas_sp.AAC.1